MNANNTHPKHMPHQHIDYTSFLLLIGGTGISLINGLMGLLVFITALMLNIIKIRKELKKKD
jgi:protein-S-isoprenylcysteine O-methyltransferase Ste14